MTKKCPVCGKGNLYLAPSIRWWVNLLVAIFFFPAWFITIIITYTKKKYKCNVCNKLFDRKSIDNMR